MRAVAIIQAAREHPCRPWPRHVLLREQWQAMAEALADDTLDLLALWADSTQVHALFAGPLLASTPVHEGAYAALSSWRPVAAGFERMVRDLWGHEAVGGVDARPLLDHGAWDMVRPLSVRPGPSAGRSELVLRPGQDEWRQVPLGPVLPWITEPAHWRLHAVGEAVRQAELRSGYAHKGCLALMRGKSPRAAARFAARITGDGTVAHSIAFARAAEAALAIEAPSRAHALRAVMAELERAAAHLDTLGQLCGAAGFGLAAAQFGRQREALARAAAAAFGHRLMMDAVVPGGVAVDIAAAGAPAILTALEGLSDAGAWYSDAMADRLIGVGHMPDGGVGAGGVVGRAAGRPGDARVTPGYPPYDRLAVAVPVLAAGDADAQARVRLAEIAESARLVRLLLGALPPGSVNVALPSVSGEGLGVAEGARGDVWHWLRLDGGMIATAFAVDPSWRLGPLAELGMATGGIEDVELVVRSFDASASGMDL
jgi:Ni,Fe-hydrogenase III large subunit